MSSGESDCIKCVIEETLKNALCDESKYPNWVKSSCENIDREKMQFFMLEILGHRIF
jgi:hypothetical protein